jgi:hypothetical protein
VGLAINGPAGEMGVTLVKGRISGFAIFCIVVLVLLAAGLIVGGSYYFIKQKREKRRRI